METAEFDALVEAVADAILERNRAAWRAMDPEREKAAYRQAVRQGFMTVSDVIAQSSPRLDDPDTEPALEGPPNPNRPGPMRGGNAEVLPALPRDFVRATWRGTLPLHPKSKERCVSFDLEDGTTIRLCLPYHDSIQVHQTFAPGHDDWCQAEIYKMGPPGAEMVQSRSESLIPSAPKSVPSENEKCDPTDASPAAK